MSISGRHDGGFGDAVTEPHARARDETVRLGKTTRGSSGRLYDISPVDGRFLMTKPATRDSAGMINISGALNWFEELRERVPLRPVRPQLDQYLDQPKGSTKVTSLVGTDRGRESGRATHSQPDDGGVVRRAVRSEVGRATGEAVVDGWQHDAFIDRGPTVVSSGTPSRAPLRACEEITFNAETAEAAEQEPQEFSACSACSALNVVFFHRLSVHRPEVEIGGTLANFSTVLGPFFDRFAEVEPNEDARIRILGRRLGEAGIRAEHW